MPTIKKQFPRRTPIVTVAPGKKTTATLKVPYTGRLRGIAYLSGVAKCFKIEKMTVAGANKRIKNTNADHPVTANQKIIVTAKNITKKKADFSMSAIVEVAEEIPA